MPNALSEYIPKQFLTGWLVTEALMTLLFAALLIWTSVEHPSALVPLIIYGLHYGATALAFLIVEDLEKRLHKSQRGSSLIQLHSTPLRQFSWILLLFAILLTDVFSLVYEALEGHTHPLGLRVLTLVLWSYGTVSSLIYLLFAAAYQALEFKRL
jgi:hypothetical protein